ncbi:hypothetical protein D3C77_404060 [compost metagenome]
MSNNATEFGLSIGSATALSANRLVSVRSASIKTLNINLVRNINLFSLLKEVGIAKYASNSLAASFTYWWNAASLITCSKNICLVLANSVKSLSRTRSK